MLSRLSTGDHNKSGRAPTCVCLVVQNVYDNDPRVRRKAEALAANGYAVDVLALRPEGGPKTYPLNGVDVRTISLGKKRGSLFRYAFEYALFFAWVSWRLPRDMRRKSYTVIDINSLPDFLIFAGVGARMMGAKLILDLHEITPEFYMSKYGAPESSWVIRLLTYIEQISASFADGVLTINESILDLLVSRGLERSKSAIIMNSVDEERFVRQNRASATAVPASGDRFVMMYHGTLTRIYGLDIAIEALALAQRDLPTAELWILGSGTEEAALTELARARGLESKVRMMGRVPAAEIPDWLRRCTVGLLPIRRDVFLDFAFPNKLPEFIISGKPVIISSLPAIRRSFSQDALAYSEPNDAVALSRQMLRLYRDPELRGKLVRKAAEEYAPIRWAVMKERYLSFIGRFSGLGGDEKFAALPASAGGRHRSL